MANRRYIDFPIAASVGNNDIVLIWQDGLNKQTTKETLLQGSPQSLAGLTDVDIAGLINGQILQYNSTTSKWENVDRTDINLSELGDVTIVAPANGQVLVYNSSTGKWENSSAGYVPYTGAVTTVNLGAQSILAGSFVKAGGTASQFLKANGSVDSTAYGTGSVTSVALTMPTAFSVAGSPITTAGTLAVTATGTTGQYIRGDGSLATLPSPGSGTVTSVAALTLGTAGTDLSSSVANPTTTPVITLNVPTASATNRGALSSADWTTFNNKENAITAGTTAQYFRGDKTFQTLNTAAVPELTNLYYTEARVNANTNVAANTAARHNAVTLGTANGLSLSTQVLSLGLASAGVTGALSGTDWTTFNGKQNALTNPVTGTGTSGRVAYWNGTNSITSDADLLFDGSNLTVGGNVLVGSNQIIGINTADASDTGYLSICGASSDGPDRAGHIYLSGNERGTDAGSVVIAGGNTTTGTGATAAIVFRTLGTNKARLTSAGNFGIGTDTPVTFGTRNLDVNGGAGSAYIVARGINNTGTIEMAFDGGGYIGTKTAHDLIIRTSDLQRINVFATSGNVLVGTGSDNGAKFQVNGTANFTGSIQAATDSNIVGTSINARIIVTASGVANTVVGFNNSGSTTTGVTNNTAYLGVLQSYPLVFTTNSIERLRIEATGESTFTSTVQTSTFFRSNTPRTNSVTIGVSANANYNFIGNDNFWGIRTGTAGDFNIDVNNSSSPINSFKIAQTGVATFSGPNQSQNAVFNSTGNVLVTFNASPAVNNGGSLSLGGRYWTASNTIATFGRIHGKKENSIDGGTAGYLSFETTLDATAFLSEKMRITSIGNVLINSNSVSSQGEIFFVTATNLAAMFRTTGGAANNWAANFWNNATSGNNLFIEFGTETAFAGRGSVTYNRGSGVVAYNTTSDYRIKSEIKDFNAFDIIKNLKPKEFKIGNAENKSIGFIAHELQEFFPQAVHGEKDAEDANKKPIYQGVDYSQLTGLLVKAIQELKQEIDTFKK